MRFEQVATFDAVVRHGSFRLAAHALHLSQPAVSEHIAKLEQHLGVPLFIRGPRGARLSPAGHDLLPDMRAILRAQQSAEHHATALAGGAAGTVRVAAVNSVLNGLLPLASRRLETEFPKLDLVMTETGADEVRAGVIDGTYDLGITAITGTPQSTADLQITPLLVGPLRLLTPTGHPLLTADRVTRKDVARGPIIALHPTLRIRLDLDEYLGGQPARIRAEVAALDSVRRLVAAGLGISVLPEVSLRLLSPGDGVATRALTDHPSRTGYYTMQRGGHLSKALDVLSEVLESTAAAVPDLPPADDPPPVG